MSAFHHQRLSISATTAAATGVAMLATVGRIAAGLALVWLVIACTPALAQVPIYEQQPFDRIVLNPANGSTVLRVRPLKLPERRVPFPFPGGRLKLRLIDKPAQEFEVAWSNIARIELFEQIILQEGLKLANDNKFDEAYDYFAKLYSRYPHTPGLATATSRYLQRNALAAFKEGEHSRALAMLASLYERQPNFSGLNKAVDTVTDQIIQGHLKQRDLRTARSVLDVVDKQFADLELDVINRWQDKFRKAADAQMEAGVKAFRQQEYRQARAAAMQAKTIWPGHQQAQELLQLIQRDHPTVIVGVRTISPQPLRPRVDSPASIRTSFLAAPTLTRITDYSAEGGVYASPIGALGLDPTGRELSLTVLDYPAGSPESLDAPAVVARWLLRAADPRREEYTPLLGQVVGSVVTPEADLLVMGLARTHVRPESLLQDVLLEDCGLPSPIGAYHAMPAEAGTLQLESVDTEATVAVIEELLFSSDDEAVKALVQGDIDILDRVAPWQVSALRSNRNITVGQYRLPTVHVLIPTHAKSLLDEREFRRALCYGIDRRRVLKELILGGAKLPGFQVISGPFPSGITLNDNVRYGYNDAVQPRPYEPRLAGLLAAVAWTKVQKAEKGKEDPADAPFPTLRLAHSSDPVARTACQAIQLQLQPLGIPIELVELEPQQLLDPDGDFDLRYAELCSWEPVVDAMRILGRDGVAGRCTDPMHAALQRLDEARNWNDAIAGLHDIHELAAGDLPVIPLWQTSNYYAHHRSFGGLPPTTIHLYQSLADWRKDFAENR